MFPLEKSVVYFTKSLFLLSHIYIYIYPIFCLLNFFLLRKALSINKANYPIFLFMQCFPLEKRVMFIQFFLLRKVLSISQSHLFFSVTSLYIHIYISAYLLYLYLSRLLLKLFFDQQKSTVTMSTMGFKGS